MSRIQLSHLSLEVHGTEQNQHQTLQTRYMHNIAHEVRTPLTIILGYANLLHSGKLGELEPEQQEALAAILDSSSDLWGLLERVNALLTTETHLSVALEVDLAKIATKVLDQNHAFITQAGLRVQTQFEPGLSAVPGDPYLVEQAVQCLVDNAIKFTSNGGRISLSTLRDGPWACVAVEDTGIGIAPEYLQTIFTPFFQVDATATRRYGGCGLGLTVVKAVADEHFGAVEVTSQLGIGSRFVLKLPYQPPASPDPHH
jgi:signal transduction histidine kinase